MRSCQECGLRYESEDQFCSADGAPLVESSDPLIGESIGKYRLVRSIGSGGMGEVYLGLHPTIGSRVAIKVLSATASSDAELVRRFFAEAQSVNRIRHESIVNVLDLDSLEDGRPFIIMEFLDGEPLSSMLDRQRLPIGTTARLGVEILSALSAAHQAGVVHRDLKPDNIFITQRGRVKILDFGIAKLMPGYDATNTPSSTRTGSLLGTPAYMSPEQVIGREVGPETDLFALGAILYEALTGRRAFDGTSLFELMRQVVDEHPPPVESMRPEVPGALSAIIRQAMAKIAKERFASAAAMSDALERVCTGLRGDEFEPLRPQAASATPAPQAKSHGNTAFAETGYSGVQEIDPSSIAMASTQAATHPMAGRQAPPPSQPSMAWQDTQAATHPLVGRQSTPAPPPVLPVESKKRSPFLAIGVGLVLVGGGAAAFFLGKADGEKQQAAAPAPVAAAATAMDAGAAPVEQGSPGGEATPSAADAAPTTAPQPTAPVIKSSRTSNERPRASDPDAAPKPAPSETVTESVEPPPLKERLEASGVTIIETGEQHKDKQIRIAPDFNPTSFEAASYVNKARAHAKKIYPDAYLFEFDVAGVRPNGKSNLALANFEANYYFLSPSHSKRSMPIGVEEDIPCKVYVELTKSSMVARIVTDEDCKEKRRPNPKCSIKEVWDRAIKLGAPSENVVAEIDYLWDGWFFSIDAIDFSESIPDDC